MVLGIRRAIVACKWVGLNLLGAIIICLLAFILVIGPTAVILETVDLVRMDAQTSGVVTDIKIDRGTKGTSSTRISYRFFANGAQIESDRMFPGFFGNRGRFTGGSEMANELRVGKRCDVFYDSASPVRCSLKCGWFKWSIGLTAIIWGFIPFAVLQKRNSLWKIPFIATAIYGIGLILFGSATVFVNGVIWHLLVIAAIIILIFAAVRLQRFTSEQRDAPEPRSGAV